MIKVTFIIFAFGSLGVQSDHNSGSIEKSINNILMCFSNRSISCLGLYTINPEQLYVLDHKGKKVAHPTFLSDAFSKSSRISLYRIACERSRFKYKLFSVNAHQYEVIFFENDAFSSGASFQDLSGRPDTIQCGFIKVNGVWKLSDSVCGYLDFDQ